MVLPDLSNVFGDNPKHTWDVLRRVVRFHLQKRFRVNVNEDLIEDTVSDAICKLVEYWAGLPSSITEDTERNWNYACKYARWKAAELLHRELEKRKNEVLFSTPVRRNRPLNGRGDRGSLTTQDYAEFAAQLEAERGEMPQEEWDRRIERFLDEVGDEDLTEFRQRADGVTVREMAKQQGVSHVAIVRRCERKRRRLASVARRCGLEIL